MTRSNNNNETKLNTKHFLNTRCKYLVKTFFSYKDISIVY